MKLVNLDNIKYIFQIPLEWFQRVHNASFNSYGEDFIVVTNEDSGINKIGIDEQDFAAKVEQYASGKVKTVDGHEPDDNGNVSFDLDANKVVVTDDAGHLTTTDDEYATVDYVDQEVKTALDTAEEALTTAEEAQTTANNAQTTATTAQTTANNAATAAAAADTHAGEAYTEATRAWNRAGTAEVKADAAQTAADNAQSTADTAYDSALDATQLASEAYQEALDAAELAEQADATATEAKQIAESAFSPTNKPTHNDISDWDTATSDFVTASSKPTSSRYVVLNDTQLSPVDPVQSGNSLLCYKNGQPFQVVFENKTGIVINVDDELGTAGTQPNSFICTNSENQVGSLTSTGGGYPMFNANGVPQVQTFEPNKFVITGSNGLLGTAALANDGFLYNDDGNLTFYGFGTTAGTIAEGNHTHSGYVEKPSGSTLQTTDVTVVTNVSWNGTALNISASKLSFKNGLLVSVGSASIPSIGTVTYNP